MSAGYIRLDNTIEALEINTAFSLTHYKACDHAPKSQWLSVNIWAWNETQNLRSIFFYESVLYLEKDGSDSA